MSGGVTNERRIAGEAIATFDHPTNPDSVTIQALNIVRARGYFEAIVAELISLERLDPEKESNCMLFAEKQLLHEQQHTEAA